MRRWLMFISLGLFALAVCGLLASGRSGLGSPDAAFAQSPGPDHVPVTLLDSEGKPIDPGSPNLEPYSPRQTCGKCHDHKLINKSYHFQLGADGISDDYGKQTGKPWTSSRGQFGRQQHMSYSWVAKKRNTSADEIGMTPDPQPGLGA